MTPEIDAAIEQSEVHMPKWAARSAVAVAVGAMSLGLAGSAMGAAHVQQDGLVNVAIGDVTVLQDVNIGVAALVAANVCGVNVGPVAVLGRAVDRSGADRVVCEAGDRGQVVIRQN
jgi:hypothetical protein